MIRRPLFSYFLTLSYPLSRAHVRTQTRAELSPLSRGLCFPSSTFLFSVRGTLRFFSFIVSPDFHLHFRCALYTRFRVKHGLKKKEEKKRGQKKTKKNIYERPRAIASDFRVRDFYFRVYISSDYYTIIPLISLV